MNVVVYITYEMDGSDLKYKYEPRALYSAEYKVEEPHFDDTPNGTTREIYNRHGVRFIFVQTGELGKVGVWRRRGSVAEPATVRLTQLPSPLSPLSLSPV